MNISPEAYNSWNDPQFQDGQELLQQIKEEILDQNERVGLLVDVGCGSGNMTKVLADSIPHQRILSCDIDEKMVNASRNLLRSKPSVEFFVQDISQPWEKLDQKLRAVECQVDVVFSNYVLHWVNDSLRSLVASNILRLLRPGGRIYINVVHLNNFNEFLPLDEKERNEKLLKIPSRDEQLKKWTDCFKNAGLEKINVEYFSKFGEFPDSSMFDIFRKLAHIFATYLPLDLDEGEKSRIVNEFQDILVRNHATPMGSKLVEKIESHHTKWYYGQFRITGTK